MDVRILGCSGGRSTELELTSYLIDECLLIDTGAVTSALHLDEQETITDILITHAHLDHTLGLALLYENTRASLVRPVDVWATGPVIGEIREHILTPSIMPLVRNDETGIPGLNLHSIQLEIPFRVGSYEVEAFPVNHTRGSVAFRVSDSDHTFFFTGDTGRTDRIWRWIKKKGKLDCLIAEASFPDRMEELANISKHLTPQTLVESLDRAGIGPDHKVHVVHIKPAFMDEMREEIKSKKGKKLIVVSKGDVIKLDKGSIAKVLPEAEEKVRNKVIEFDRSADLYDQKSRLTSEFGISVGAGDIVFRQGDKSRIMYVIQEGKVRVYREAEGVERTLATIGAGEFFGEMAMLNNRPRSATVSAITDLKLMAFDRPAFEKLVVDNFGVALRIIRTLAQRLQEADTVIENLLYFDTESKVINTIVHAAYDEGIETEEGFMLLTSPEELSDKSGVVVNTLRNILSELVDDDFIIARRETLVIPNVPRLKRLLKFIELRDEFS